MRLKVVLKYVKITIDNKQERGWRNYAEIKKTYYSMLDASNIKPYTYQTRENDKQYIC
jgi:hypothetical protein